MARLGHKEPKEQKAPLALLGHKEPKDQQGQLAHKDLRVTQVPMEVKARRVHRAHKGQQDPRGAAVAVA